MKLQKLRNQIENYNLPSIVSLLLTYLIKLPLFKILDFVNNRLYYLKPQKEFKQNIDLFSKEKELYQDFLDRVDPDGLYMYAIKNDGTVDVGDRCFHQGIVIAMECYKLLTVSNNKRNYSTIIKLLNGINHFVSNKGFLIRGFTNWKFEDFGGKWTKLKSTKFAIHPSSGDQLIGFCFGISVLLNTKIFYKLDITIQSMITNMIIRLTNQMINDKWKLRSFKNNSKIGTHGYFNPNLCLASGAALAPLCLLSVAYSITKNKKYETEYFRLWYYHGYRVLSKYSELHLLNWNNWFGANVCALGLFTIKQSSLFKKEIQHGLERLSYNTRDYGHLLFDIFKTWPNKIDNYYSKYKLNSYFVKDGFDLTKKPWWSKKELRISALSKRSLTDSDFIIQREPFRALVNDDEWNKKKFGRHDFLLEYYMDLLSEL